VTTWRHVAPAGTPIALSTLLSWSGRLLRGGDHVAALAAAVRERFDVAACTPTATGRAGLVLVLRALARLAPPSRTDVVIPSYTCYTVAASVVVAGLRPRVVDIDPDTLDFDPAALERVDFSRALAIVPTNLFGLPGDLPRLAALARAHGVRLVDDAAQAMGAAAGGRASGTWGDAGLYSLDKGKNITAIEGGLVVTRDAEVAAAIAEDARALTPQRPMVVARDVVKLLAYALLLRPWLYWIPNGIPQLQLGTTAYTPHIAAERYAGALAAMGLTMLDRLDDLNAARRRVAASMAEAVDSAAGLSPIRVHSGATPVYVRFPVLARDETHRDELRRALVARGIGATGSYPTAVVDIPELAGPMAPYRDDCPGGRDVARRILTLPTHAYVSRRDIEIVHDTVRGAAAVAGARPAWARERSS
jgi:dTDP-4-amino-4,6-dideoxygalactose transaminase